MMWEYPPTLNGDTYKQLRDLYSYLYRLTDNLIAQAGSMGTMAAAGMSAQQRQEMEQSQQELQRVKRQIMDARRQLEAMKPIKDDMIVEMWEGTT